MTQISVRTKCVIVLVAAISFSTSVLMFHDYLGFGLPKEIRLALRNSSRITEKARRGYSSLFLKEQPIRVIISSNRLDLILTEYFMPLEFTNGAGGISADGVGGVLLLDLSGKVFRFWEGRIERLDIVTPNSHVDALKRQLAEGALGNIEINFGHFRYNDILLFSSDKHLYLLVSFTEWHKDGRCFTSTLAKVPLHSGDPSEWSVREADWTMVARTRPCLSPFSSGFGIIGAEAGGRMASRSDTEVLWTSGAYHRDDDIDKAHPEESIAQSDDTDYGKVLLVDIEQNTVRSLAKGLRNPQGIDIDEFGNPLVTDHGMRGGDELNVVKEGANFGYPLVTLGTKYTKKPGGVKTFHTGHGGFDKPIVAFVPSIAPSSVLYIKNFNSNWDGNILVGALKRTLYRVYIEDGDVLFVEPIDLDLRIRDMGRISDGRIAIFTDDNKIAFIEPVTASHQYKRFQSLLAAESDLELRVSTQKTFDSCLQCHGLEENEQGAGPTLYRVCGRKPGTVKLFEYSGALSRSVDLWDKDSLVRFVSDPNGTAPGTSMAWNGIGRQAVAELLARTLCQLALPSDGSVGANPG